MRGIFDFLLLQSGILSLLLWLTVATFIFYWLQKRKLALSLLVFTAIVFCSFSTAWLPRYLAKQLEIKYQPFDPKSIPTGHGKIYIHVLGSGYQSDERLPATAKLGMVSQGRLVEAMRLYYQLDSSILVCSAAGLPGVETQAEVTKKAALLLGADSNRVITLNTPTTTIEEAGALAAAIGTKATVIVVTDALHIPRAIKVFSRQGFSPLAAPTNFRAINGAEGIRLKWWPRLENLEVTDRVLHEYLSSLKAGL